MQGMKAVCQEFFWQNSGVILTKRRFSTEFAMLEELDTIKNHLSLAFPGIFMLMHESQGEIRE